MIGMHVCYLFVGSAGLVYVASIVKLLTEESNHYSLRTYLFGLPDGLPSFYLAEHELRGHVDAVHNVTVLSVERLDLLGNVFEPRDILIHDSGPCFWVAQASFRHVGRIATGTGGEFIWCLELMKNLMEQQKRRLFITNDHHVADFITRKSSSEGHPIVAIHHWSAGLNMAHRWQTLWNLGMWYQFPTFLNHKCTLKMTFFGVSSLSKADASGEPTLPSLDRYLVPFPHKSIAGNTVTGFNDLYDVCSHPGLVEPAAHPPSLTDSDAKIFQLLGTTYAIIYGKFNVDQDLREIHNFLRNRTMWENIHSKTKILVLKCHPNLFQCLDTEEDYFICLDNDSVFKSPPYYNILLKSSTVLIGLGKPILSTSPLEALACNVPVLLPSGQHLFLDESANDDSTLYISANDANEMIAGLDKVLYCRHHPGNADCPQMRGIGRSIKRALDSSNFQEVINRVHQECNTDLDDTPWSWSSSN